MVRPVPTEVPDRDRDLFRLVVTRSMYDNGVLMAHSPALAGLAPGTRLVVEPSDLLRLGVNDGGTVVVTGPGGRLNVVVGSDPGVTRGTAHVLFNQSGLDAGDLIDASASVTDLRMEKAP